MCFCVSGQCLCKRDGGRRCVSVCVRSMSVCQVNVYVREVERESVFLCVCPEISVCVREMEGEGVFLCVSGQCLCKRDGREKVCFCVCLEIKVSVREPGGESDCVFVCVA